MSPWFFLCVFLLSATTVQETHGWGVEGHTLVAALAQSQLTERALNWIRFLLPSSLSGNLSAVATWADDVLYSNNIPLGPSSVWQWSRPLHYTNTPDWNCSYDQERDCPNDICIEGALRNYSQRAIAPDLDYIQHQQAIVLLVHCVGDVHQPLHAGFQGDAGASQLSVYYMNTRRTLHSVWDTHLIRTRLSLNFQSNISLYYEHIYQLMVNQTSSQDDQNFAEWTDESAKIVCEQLYLDENNQTMNVSSTIRLSDRYYLRNIDKVEQRLAQAGRRLAILFNLLAENQTDLSITSSSPSSQAPSTVVTSFIRTSPLSSSQISSTETSSSTVFLTATSSSTRTSSTIVSFTESSSSTVSHTTISSSCGKTYFDTFAIILSLCLAMTVEISVFA